VTSERSAAPEGLPRLLGRDYGLILSTPAAGIDQAAIDATAERHIGWLLGLERDDVLVLSGRLLSGPGTEPASGHRDARRRADGKGAVAAQQRRFARRQVPGRTLGHVRRPEQAGAALYPDRLAEPCRLSVQRSQRDSVAAAAKPLAGWVRATDIASGLARYRARCGPGLGGRPRRQGGRIERHFHHGGLSDGGEVGGRRDQH
jgi:hypothetical protein